MRVPIKRGLPAPDAQFAAAKQKILDQLAVPDAEYDDLSPKGSVDAPIRALIARINAVDGFVTTSSCSGRVSVFVEGAKKNKKKTTMTRVDMDNHDNDALPIMSDLPSLEGPANQLRFVDNPAAYTMPLAGQLTEQPPRNPMSLAALQIMADHQRKLDNPAPKAAAWPWPSADSFISDSQVAPAKLDTAAQIEQRQRLCQECNVRRQEMERVARQETERAVRKEAERAKLEAERERREDDLASIKRPAEALASVGGKGGGGTWIYVNHGQLETDKLRAEMMKLVQQWQASGPSDDMDIASHIHFKYEPFVGVKGISL